MALDIGAYNQINTSNQVQGYGGQNTATASVSASTTSSVPVDTANIKLNAGDVVSGEVVDVKNGSITLKLDNNQYLSAELENSMNLSVGQKLLFQVSSNGEQTALRPLYTNLNNNLAANAALNQANLPKTASNLAMVSTMMDEGMSVNKQALLNMARSVASNPTTNPSTIVEMSKLSLEITPANIEQYENYKSFEHQIINDVTDLSTGLSNLIGNGEATLPASEDGFVVINQNNSSQVLNEVSLKLTNDILSLLESGDKDWNSLLNNSEVSGNAIQTVGVAMAEALVQEVPDNIPTVVEKVWAINFNPEDSGESATSTSVDIGNAKTGDASTMMSGDQMSGGFNDLMKNFQEELGKLGMPSEELSKINDGTMSANEVIDFIKNIINNATNTDSLTNAQKETLSKLLNNSDFKQLVGDMLMKQWILNPKDIAKEGEVEELYKRLSEQANKAIEILRNSGLDGTEVMKSAQNINDNVNFMNQINQMAAYVQLPVRMNEENAHGELYVYTKKKNLANKDGNVSAFLHLDMENLGPMDVYVAMQKNKVTTNFYLADDDALNLIEANIDILNDRLTKRGYDMSAQIVKKDPNEPQKTVVSEMLKDSSNGTVGGSIAKRMSFDVRA